MKRGRNIITITMDEILFILWGMIYYLGSTILQGIPYPIYIMSYLTVGVVAFGYVYCAGGKRGAISKGVLFCVLLNICQLFSVSYNMNGDIQELLYVWGFMGITLLLYRGRVRACVAGGLFYGIVLSCAWAMLKGIDASVYMRSSQNGVSGNVVFFLMLYYLLRYRETKKIIYFPAGISLLFCIWGQGRAGIFTVLIFILLLFIYDWFCVRGNKVSGLLKAGSIILIGLFGLFVFFNDYLVEFLERWKIFGLQTSRYEIWKSYGRAVMKAPVANILLGAPTEGTGYTILDLYKGNLHNSFFMLHCRYGLGGFLVVVLLIVSFVREKVKCKQFFVIVIMFTIGIRSCFDWTAFPGVYEILFYYLFFLLGDRGAIKMKRGEYDVSSAVK